MRAARGREGGGGWGGGSEGWSSFMRERGPGEDRQQWCCLPSQTALGASHPVIKVHGYQAQLETR